MEEKLNVFSIAKISGIKNVLSQLNKSKVPYALIKGDALSMQIYGLPGKRKYGDVDFLLDRRDLSKMKTILKINGFNDMSANRESQVTMLLTSHQVSPWVKDLSPFGILEVDLNIDIIWGEYEGSRIDIRNFLNDTVEIDIYGIALKVLPLEKALLQLILHHYKDMNSLFLLATRKVIKKEKFFEIYRLIKNNYQKISLETFYKICKDYNTIPYAYYILYYTNVVVGDNPFLAQYISLLCNEQGMELLNYYGLKKEEQRKWKVDFETRLQSTNEYALIKDDLSEKDEKKIEINKRMFGVL